MSTEKFPEFQEALISTEQHNHIVRVLNEPYEDLSELSALVEDESDENIENLMPQQ